MKLIFAFLIFPAAFVVAAPIGTVSFVEGDAFRIAKPGPGSAKIKLKQGSPLHQGDRVRTEAKAKLEIKLLDGSILRLAERSELALDTVVFKKKEEKREVGAKLMLGRIWASVSGAMNKEGSHFEVSSPNAVAGVRGTRFAAAYSEDGTTTVKVYSGAVLVSNKPVYAVKGATKATRQQVSGPQEISKESWQELVASAMQMIQVAAAGEISKPEAFAMAGPTDDWEAWNTERDKLASAE